MTTRRTKATIITISIVIFLIIMGLIIYIGFISGRGEEEAKIPVATKQELLDEVNRRRSEAGVAPLEYSPELEASAQQKCEDMVNRHYYDHIDPDGKQGYEIAMEKLGREGYFSENLNSRLELDDSAQNVFDSWWTSTPHREAALDPRYILTGFGVCGDLEPSSKKDRTYFVEHFYSEQ